MSVLIGGPNGRLAFVLNSLSSLNIEIIIIIIVFLLKLCILQEELLTGWKMK